jgi:hypothetical protein
MATPKEAGSIADLGELRAKTTQQRRTLMSKLRITQTIQYGAIATALRAVTLSLLALAPTLVANPRTPLGIYAVVNVTEYENVYLQTHSSVPADYFRNTVFPGLLANPAVSGIALCETWAMLNPHQSGSGAYDWSLLQDLFDQVSLWNTNNPTKPAKTIQLVLLPGFNSPPWLMSQINSCNFLFDPRIVHPYGDICGKATFNGFVEGGTVDGNPIPMDLPMPWDATYKGAWQTFLTALAMQYGSRPELVSIAVAGPTASSAEMILPCKESIVSGASQIAGLTPEEMWDKLLAHFFTNPALLQTDQAIIDEWKKAIDMYGETFSGITLVVITGNGLPNLTGCHIYGTQTCTFTLPKDPITDFATVCPGATTNPGANMDCASETTILAYFKESTVGGPNAKATETNGMRGSSSAADNLGLTSVKLISQTTELYKSSPSKQILGGAQFDKSFKNFPVEEGCSSVFPPKGYASVGLVPVGSIPSACLNPNNTTTLAAAGFTFFDQAAEAAYLISPEQAEYNVLNWYFKDTGAGSFFGGPTAFGQAPLNYVQIYGPDIPYATGATTPVAVVVSGTPIMITAQELLSLASAAIGVIAEK